MFDKITIRAAVSGEECAHLAQLHHLRVMYNEDKTMIEYHSGSYAKFSGIQIKIVRNKVTLICSLHKYWNNLNFGQLRNDTIFTISEAKLAFESLCFENGFIAEKVSIVEFEIGLNLHVDYDPITFIELVNYIAANNNRPNKTMFVDANYHINRQKTSEKYRDIRRYFKIYDKGWEMDGKKRSKNKEPITLSSEWILRIETVHRRYNERADKFFTDENIKRLVQRFWVDWKDLFFVREIRALKGAKKSEKERAKILVNIGAEDYLKQIKDEYSENKLTCKEYRTIREFIRDFEKNEHKYKVVISAQEKQYNTLLPRVFKLTKT